MQVNIQYEYEYILVRGAGSSSSRGRHLAEDGELVVRQEAVAAVEQEVAPRELLEAPVLAGHEPIRLLALCTRTRTRTLRKPYSYVDTLACARCTMPSALTN